MEISQEAERKPLSYFEREYLEITTDGRTVWVNSPICIGRLCKISGEVILDQHCEYIRPPDWESWKAGLKKYYDVDVPDKYKPEWSK